MPTKSGVRGTDALTVVYLKGVTNGKDVARELIAALEEYIVLLGKELDEVIPMAAVHGWKSSRYEEGKVARRKIQRLKITNNHLEKGGVR